MGSAVTSNCAMSGIGRGGRGGLAPRTGPTRIGEAPTIFSTCMDHHHSAWGNGPCSCVVPHAACPGYPADGARVVVSESLVLAASPSTLASAPDLTALGVGLSLDNFGTGCSSVTALNRLPIDSFKIDRSIIADPSDNPTSASLVEGLISLGSHMDLDVIAGGIETQAQAEWLTSRGCPHGQGYYLGRPSAPAPSDPPDA